MTTQLIVLSDFHINSTVAVCPPSINLDDGGTYGASRTQYWLWRCLLDIAERAKAMPADRRILVLNGDLAELDNKKRSIQLITLNKTTILSMVIATLQPLLEMCDAYYVIRGTPAHEGKSCWIETELGRDIGAVQDPATGAFSWWHLRTVCEGVRLDVAHHASMGRAPWSKKNAAQNLAARMMWEYRVDMDQQPPHVAFRAHNHTFADSYDAQRIRVVYGGALTTKTEYAYRCGYENVISDIGGYSLLCDNGQYRLDKLQCLPRKERIWAAEM